MEKENKNPHPFSVNFKTLLQYDFSKVKIEEIIFFEWLNVKRINFKSNTFFYQQKRISDETGIKRTKLQSIRSSFIELELFVEHKGHLNTTHYTVSNNFIENFINEYVKEHYKKDLLLKINTITFKNKTNFTDKELYNFEDLYNNLNAIYNQLRKQNDRKFPTTELAYNQKTTKQLIQLLTKYNRRTISNAFYPYIEDILTGNQQTKHPLNHFSMYKPNEGSFPIFDHYLNKMNKEYKTRQ